jgi:hypothetical protein
VIGCRIILFAMAIRRGYVIKSKVRSLPMKGNESFLNPVVAREARHHGVYSSIAGIT